jgi:hypothetical protein
MEDYGMLPLNQLIDLLAEYTSKYTKLYFDNSHDVEHLNELKSKIIALQEEIKRKKGK